MTATWSKLASILLKLSLLAFFSSIPRADAAETGRLDCREKIVDFLECVNRTISEKHTSGSKFQLAKMRVNECLQTNGCAKMYITEEKTGDPDDENSGPSGPGHFHQSFRAVHQCMRDLREQIHPMVQKCVALVVPDNPPFKQHIENRWKLIQQAMNKTQLQRLCTYNGNATGALSCVDRVFTPNHRARQDQERKFNDFCGAVRQCRVGMGLCRTELDNGRKAICDCFSRIFEDYNNIKKSVPACANITSDMIKTSRSFHPPFMDEDCGPDPCDSTFQHLISTNGDDKDDDDRASEGDSETGP